MLATGLPSCARHRQVVETYLQDRNVTPGLSVCSRSHHNVLVCDGQMGEKEKWTNLNIMETLG